MDPKRPPYSGPPGVTRIPWMQSAEDQGQPPDQPPLRRARGLILPKDEPLLGRGRGAAVEPVPIPDIRKLEAQEKMPKLQAQVTPAIAKVDAPGLGLSLVSMFRGLSIEPGKTWDRGATPLEKMINGINEQLLNFSPNVESLGMCFGMMKEHRPTTGEVVAFDGSILYLPKRLEEVNKLREKPIIKRSTSRSS
ncbi:hypothetical protein cypCar_00008903 [Cyprinus carpio]|nr:hypothetical protein cypCar_00008903 [Cyprinus carpio]